MTAPASPARGQIGPYRIVTRVGAGGMGEVFKAWDPRLERDVAIKVLHTDSSSDPERLRRLLAEGRAASALNHPNILRVYDAEVDGASYYLVSEWLDGKSLRDELTLGPLPLRRLLDLSVQIADGLAAAHSIGIVHRDIKPANVMLARDGSARIVDFGLSRSGGPSGSFSDVDPVSDTVSVDGAMSGTPAYMSPEQARGAVGDFRTDQFSFGALMYEMATGRAAFRRDTVAETLSAIVHQEPQPIAELNPRVPAPFRWIVERCQAKDANERYTATDDLARELRWLRNRLPEALVEPKVDPRSATAHRWARPVVSAAIAIVSVVAYVVGSATPAPSYSFRPIASSAGYEGRPAWSPDGQSLAWVADVDGVLQLFVRRLNDTVATQLTKRPFDVNEPFWAPDGQRLYFVSPAGQAMCLWTVAAAGGRPEIVLERVVQAAIDPFGQRLALTRPEAGSTMVRRLWWSAPPGAEPVPEMRPPFGDHGFGLGGQLQFSPDGTKLLIWTASTNQQPHVSPSNYYLLPLPYGGPAREVLTEIAGSVSVQPFSWLPDSRHVVVSMATPVIGNRHLWLADTESSSVTQLTSTHTTETWPAVAPEGRRIAYASEEVDFDLVAISEDGRAQQKALATARNEFDPTWSPSGDRFAFVTDRDGAIEIWSRSRDGQWERPIVTAADFGGSRTETLGSLAYSPDGRTLAYQRRGPDQASIWLSAATGGTPVQLGGNQDRAIYQDAPTWSPDGEWIAFTRSDGRNFSLAKIRVGSNEVVPILDYVAPYFRSVWSPDGKWIACQTFKGLVRVAVDGGSKPELFFDDYVLAFTWAPDSRRVFALADGETQGHFALIEIDTVTRDLRTLNPDLGTIPIANQPVRGFSFAKSQGFLTSLASARSDIWLLDGFQQARGWLSGLFHRP